MTPAVLLAVGGGSGTILAIAAWLLLRVSDKDVLLAARIDAAQGRWARMDAAVAKRRSPWQPVQRGLAAIGRTILQSGALPARTRAELTQTMRSSGFVSTNAVPLFLGAKLALMLALPFAGWAIGNALAFEYLTRINFAVAGGVLGLLAPDYAVRKIRTAYLAKLEAGLPDALDMMVICAQAGLSLVPAMTRVAAEMRMARPEVAMELEQTIRELEVMSDTQLALGNLASRTGLPTLKRLVATLVQTMQYGTPLSDALRTLSVELRQQALTRFEAGAARLSVLLTLPMILFILPCVFIIVGGPAVIQVMKTFNH